MMIRWTFYTIFFITMMMDLLHYFFHNGDDGPFTLNFFHNDDDGTLTLFFITMMMDLLHYFFHNDDGPFTLNFFHNDDDGPLTPLAIFVNSEPYNLIFFMLTILDLFHRLKFWGVLKHPSHPL